MSSDSPSLSEVPFNDFKSSIEEAALRPPPAERLKSLLPAERPPIPPLPVELFDVLSMTDMMRSWLAQVRNSFGAEVLRLVVGP